MFARGLKKEVLRARIFGEMFDSYGAVETKPNLAFLVMQRLLIYTDENCNWSVAAGEQIHILI